MARGLTQGFRLTDWMKMNEYCCITACSTRSEDNLLRNVIGFARHISSPEWRRRCSPFRSQIVLLIQVPFPDAFSTKICGLLSASFTLKMRQWRLLIIEWAQAIIIFSFLQMPAPAWMQISDFELLRPNQYSEFSGASSTDACADGTQGTKRPHGRAGGGLNGGKFEVSSAVSSCVSSCVCCVKSKCDCDWVWISC